jgi:NAD(P)H-dependent flavin oxidoreductase YrpB (nitropropane dioxygenase family)
VNRFTRESGLLAPIRQTPMGGAARPELVAAVCNAGAIGTLPIRLLPVEAARAAVGRTRTMTDRPRRYRTAAQSPDLPPRFSSSRTSDITIPRSTALSMS